MEYFDRRSFLKLGSIAAFRWTTLGEALQHRAEADTRRGDDISVIHLFLAGGMSHIDTFDLEPRFNPFDIGNPNTPNFQVRDLELPLGVDWARMDRRRSLLKLADAKFRKYDSMNLIENMNSYYQTAFGLMQSPRAKKAFDIAEEPASLRDRYG